MPETKEDQKPDVEERQPELEQRDVKHEAPDVEGEEEDQGAPKEQMCCDGKRTAEEHRSEDGKCCTD